MNIKNPFCCVLASALLLLTGCRGHTCPTCPMPPLTVAEFPTDVGIAWTYAVVDQMQELTDTVVVRIDSLTDSSGGCQTTLWTYHPRQNLITRPDQYVTRCADTVTVAYEPAGIPILKLVFPLTAGKEWNYRSVFGEFFTTVDGEATTSVPSGTYRTLVVHNKLHAFGPPDVFDESRIWIEPGVGIIRREHARGFISAQSFEIWQLLDYSAPAEVGR